MTKSDTSLSQQKLSLPTKNTDKKIRQKIAIHELSDDPIEFTVTPETALDNWLLKAIKSTQECEIPAPKTPLEQPHTDSAMAPATPSVSFSLSRQQGIVFVRGDAHLTLGLNCSRCADSFRYLIQGPFEGLFTRDRTLVEPSSLNSGVAHSEAQHNEAVSLEIEYLSSDQLDLREFLEEILRLQIPSQPLCQELCKGLCASCGQNQNTNPCQCHRLKKGNLAEALERAFSIAKTPKND